jgi:hypothetical protein
MTKQLLSFFVSFFCLTFPIFSDPISVEPGQKLVIQNRILTKINDKTISVLDVVKKMEVFLNKYYPQYAGSSAAKFQYFSSQWREVFLQMIDHELILADAAKLDLKITDSEVREAIHEKFGPNIMGSLDAIGLSYEEAKEMVHSELIVQKMTWFKIHAKALNKVNVQDIKAAYAAYCDKNPAKEILEYQVLSVKAQNEELAHQIAEKAFELCANSPNKIAEIKERLAADLPENSPEVNITLSEDFKLDAKSISSNHKETLFKLAKDSISHPVKQISRADQSSVFRIFHLKNRTKTALPSLRSMYEKLQNQLVQEAAAEESKSYIAKLRERYGFDAKALEDSIPSGFQPFSLQ